MKYSLNVLKVMGLRKTDSILYTERMRPGTAVFMNSQVALTSPQAQYQVKPFFLSSPLKPLKSGDSLSAARDPYSQVAILVKCDIKDWKYCRIPLT